MSQTTRKEVLSKLRRRYQNAGLEHKRKLLDQAQDWLGHHRKAAIRSLNTPQLERVPWIIPGRPVTYEAGRGDNARSSEGKLGSAETPEAGLSPAIILQ